MDGQKMKFCINTLMMSPSLRIFDKIKIASKNNFLGIEPWINELEHENCKDVLSCCKDYGIEICTVEQICGWFENDGELMGVTDDHYHILEECKRRMSICASLECKWIIATPAFSHRNHFSSWEQGVVYFNELWNIGKEIGCLPTIEFMGQTKQINNFSKCEKFLKDVDKGTMIIDAYHLWKSGGQMDEFINFDKEKISAFHISDADKNISRENHMDRNRVMPTDGQIDLYKFAEAVKSTGFNGFVNAGVYNKKLWDQDPNEICIKLHDSLSKLFF